MDDSKSTMQANVHESLFSDFDLYLFGQGSHDHIYNLFGAQQRTINGSRGTNFAVWAPNAQHLSVVGSFNEWDATRNPMRRLIPSGIWEVFIDEARPGDLYKYHMIDAHGSESSKADPFAFASELPPRTASIITELDGFAWSDQGWMQRRAGGHQLDGPISVYEVHLGSWRQDSRKENGWLNYRELAHQLVDHCQQLGFTHIELLPVSEHPYTGSWGYQTVGYYAVTSRYGTPQDFMYFVDYCHAHGIGVLIDWVPAHFPYDEHGLARFDGTPLYEHADPRQGSHPDWGTLIFNYGRHEVKNYLVSNALFWLDRYHVDGLRVDAVASMLYLDYSREDGQWVPNRYGGRENLEAIELLKQFNERSHADFPGILTVAEESTAWSGVSRPTSSGGLGFSLKWNMGWMNDTLRYMRNEPIHRKYHHDEITFSMIYAFTENFVLPFSHDEVVHGKGSLISQMPGDLWQKFANLRLLYSYMWTHPGKKLLFMGNEFAQWKEWNCNQSLDWDLLQWDTHQGVQRLVADLNKLLVGEPALFERDFSPEGFQWINCTDRDASLLTYVRRAADPSQHLVVVCNFTPVIRQSRRVGVPAAGTYRECLNSDSEHYGGTNVGNLGSVPTEPISWDGQRQSIDITIPPLACVIFKHDDASG